ncbi:MAG: flagellar transcriptional regulator FlhC [Limnobacter sp.]|nr:flagellar transcriptional regulator FlhC [Limnobacter sp.]
MSRKPSISPLNEAQQIQVASRLIRLQARLQVLEACTSLSRDKLIRLYKEIHHKSPSKGQLPFSTDWYVCWQSNIHSSLFMNFYQSLIKCCELDDTEALLKAFQLYQEQIALMGESEVLSITRAWRLIQFFNSGMMTTTTCTRCQGQFVTHTFELKAHFECGLCNMPSRAGKKRGFVRDEEPELV